MIKNDEQKPFNPDLVLVFYSMASRVTISQNKSQFPVMCIMNEQCKNVWVALLTLGYGKSSPGRFALENLLFLLNFISVLLFTSAGQQV